MSAKMFCRGCGNPFGEIPKNIKTNGASIYDVCPGCKSTESKRSEKALTEGLAFGYRSRRLARMYADALVSFEAQIKELKDPAKKRSQPRHVPFRRLFRSEDHP